MSRLQPSTVSYAASVDAQSFYDDLAEDYTALHVDWPNSVRWQGETLDKLIRSELGDAPQAVLDCSCGIGTQAIGLALRGHDVLATDLSPASIERARREAASMGAALTFGVADFTRLPEQVEGTFACVLSCDNSVAHLHADEDLARFAAGVAAKLRPGGLALVSLRDYAALWAERAAGHPCASGPGRSRSRSGIGTTTAAATSSRSSRCAARARAGRRPAAAPACAPCGATSCATRSPPPG